MFGIVFRFVVLIIIVVLLGISIKTLVKTKPVKKQKVINIIIIFVCIVFLSLSFISLDIKKLKIDKNISQGIDVISGKYLPETDIPQIYSIYEFDCDGYYGTVSVSKVDEEEKKKILNNKDKYELIIEDETAVALCTQMACVRDVWGVPEKCVGDIRLFKGDTRIFIKYNYKDVKILGPIKYLTFTQYFYRDIVDIKEIADSIVPDSLDVLDKTQEGSSN